MYNVHFTILFYFNKKVATLNVATDINKKQIAYEYYTIHYINNLGITNG